MNFAHLLIVVIAAIGVTIYAERRNIQPPLMIAFLGLAASFIPGLPRLELEPEIILTVVLPPLLFSAARQVSLVSFMRQIDSIVSLGVVLVVITTGVVGIATSLFVPGLSLAAALVLAAVVSPTDAVAAVALGRKLGLPSRIMTVLKGESLINDAAALTLFTFTTAALTGRGLFIDNPVLYFIYAVIAGLVIGLGLGFIVHAIRIRLANASLITVLNVLVPFTAYTLAEELGASGVLAVVAAGLALGHNAPHAGYESRIQERQFWSTLDTLLEAFVFAYIGLQFRFVIGDALASGFHPMDLVRVSALTFFAVIGIRIVWIFLTALLRRWFERLRILLNPGRRRAELPLPPPLTWRENLVIAWTGMRGVVTLAAAGGIPFAIEGGDNFVGRNAIVAVAFVVTIGTLLVQGNTLPWLISRLDLTDAKADDQRLDAFKRARDLARSAAVSAIENFRDAQSDENDRIIAERMLERVKRQTDESNPAWAGQREATVAELSRAALEARRKAVIDARENDGLDDEVVREVLEQMDREQAVADNWRPEQYGKF